MSHAAPDSRGATESRDDLVRRWYDEGHYGTTTIGEEIRNATADAEVPPGLGRQASGVVHILR